MEELNKESFEKKERQNIVVGKFNEILYEKPQHLRVVIDGNVKRETKDDILLYYTLQGSVFRVISLQKEKRWTDIHAALRGNNPKIYTKEEDAKTTIEQLRDIIQTHGEPEKIFYSRLDHDKSEGVCRNDSIAGAFFPFSEIHKELGLEE